MRTAREKSTTAGLPKREEIGLARVGSSSAPQRADRIHPGQSRLLLLVVHSARPSLAEVLLADLSFEQIRDEGSA